MSRVALSWIHGASSDSPGEAITFRASGDGSYLRVSLRRLARKPPSPPVTDGSYHNNQIAKDLFAGKLSRRGRSIAVPRKPPKTRESPLDSYVQYTQVTFDFQVPPARIFKFFRAEGAAHIGCIDGPNWRHFSLWRDRRPPAAGTRQVWHWLESRAQDADLREDIAEAFCQCCAPRDSALAGRLG